MTTLRFWFRPAVFVLFWMVVAAFTLSELASLPPSLGFAEQSSSVAARTEPAALRARAYAANRRQTAP